jgi:hypothetical protein
MQGRSGVLQQIADRPKDSDRTEQTRGEARGRLGKDDGCNIDPGRVQLVGNCQQEWMSAGKYELAPGCHSLTLEQGLDPAGTHHAWKIPAPEGKGCLITSTCNEKMTRHDMTDRLTVVKYDPVQRLSADRISRRPVVREYTPYGCPRYVIQLLPGFSLLDELPSRGIDGVCHPPVDLERPGWLSENLPPEPGLFVQYAHGQTVVHGSDCRGRPRGSCPHNGDVKELLCQIHVDSFMGCVRHGPSDRLSQGSNSCALCAM